MSIDQLKKTIPPMYKLTHAPTSHQTTPSPLLPARLQSSAFSLRRPPSAPLSSPCHLLIVDDTKSNGICCGARGKLKAGHGLFVDTAPRGSIQIQNLKLTKTGLLEGRGNLSSKLEVWKVLKRLEAPEENMPDWGPSSKKSRKGAGKNLAR